MHLSWNFKNRYTPPLSLQLLEGFALPQDASPAGALPSAPPLRAQPPNLSIQNFWVRLWSRRLLCCAYLLSVGCFLRSSICVHSIWSHFSFDRCVRVYCVRGRLSCSSCILASENDKNLEDSTHKSAETRSVTVLWCDLWSFDPKINGFSGLIVEICMSSLVILAASIFKISYG